MECDIKEEMQIDTTPVLKQARLAMLQVGLLKNCLKQVPCMLVQSSSR